MLSFCRTNTGPWSPDSPSPHDEPERLQVAVVSGPQSWCHPILIRCVQLLPCGLLQHVQVAVPGRPVVPVVHGGAPLGSLRDRFHGRSGGFAPVSWATWSPGRSRSGEARSGAGRLVARRRGLGGATTTLRHAPNRIE